MRQSLIFIAFYLFSIISVEAQYSDTIRTGRPGQAIGVFSLGKGLFQMQSGLTYAQSESVFNKIEQYTIGHIMRYGISERIEISGVIGYTHNDVRNKEDQLILKGLNSTQLGGRYHLSNKKGLIPNSCVQGRVSIQAEDPDFKRKGIQTYWIYSFAYPLPKEISLTTNINLQTNTGAPPWSYVVNVSRNIGSATAIFAEVYGTLNFNESYFDSGVGYLLNQDIQLDISTGFDLNAHQSYWFVDAGISLRWYKRKGIPGA